MDLQSAKLNLVQRLLLVQKESLIEKVSTLLDQEMIVGYTVEGKPLTKAKYDARLKEGENQILRGDFTSQDDLEKESENW